MTPEQLRASILQQAMEGKLVKQDPNDEPASILLEKITKEKARLIKEKKIKRTKKLPEITDDEKPFEIPENWEWVRLGTVFNLQAGKNRKASTINEIKTVDYDYPCFGGNGIRGYVSDFNREGKYALIGRQGALCGNINFAKGKFYATEHAVVVEIFAGTNYKWSGYFLKALNLNQYSTATAQPGLSVTKINRVLIPLPPLKEQLRIVAKIEKLMPLIDEYAKAYNRLKAIDDDFNDKMKQSILQYAMEGKLVKQDPNDEPASVLLEKIAEEKARLIKEKKIKRTKKLPEITDDEKPFEIPDSWEWVRIGNLVNIYTGLAYNKSKLQEQSNDMVRVLRGGNINGSNYTVDLYDDDVMIDRKYLAKNNLLLKRGQLLTPSVTSDKQLGKIAIVSDDYNDIVAGGFIFNIVPFIDNEVFSKYFMFVFSSRFIKQQLLNAANKSGQAFYNVSKTKFQKLTLPIPPLAEQKRIVAKINQLMATIH